MELQTKNTSPSSPKPQVQQPLKKCAPHAKHHFPVSALEISDNDRFLTIKEVIDNQIKLYNKAKQLKKSGKHIRCEVSLRFKKKALMLSDLEDVDNPFLSISIFDLSAPVPAELLIASDLFKDSCRYRGIKNALKVLKNKNKALYKAFSSLFKEAHIDWWQPEEFWGEHWMNCLEDARLLPGMVFASIAPLVHNTETQPPKL